MTIPAPCDETFCECSRCRPEASKHCFNPKYERFIANANAVLKTFNFGKGMVAGATMIEAVAQAIGEAVDEEAAREPQQPAVRDVWLDAAEEKRILLLAKYWLSGGHRETARTIRHLFSRVRELEAELRRVTK